MGWKVLHDDRKPKNFLGAYKDPRVCATVLGADTETHL